MSVVERCCAWMDGTKALNRDKEALVLVLREYLVTSVLALVRGFLGLRI